MEIQNYTGCLLAAHPKRREQDLERAVMLVVEHDIQGARAHRINYRLHNGMDLQHVMNGLGISYSGDEPIYKGGQDRYNRLFVIHTLDWFTASTIRLGENLGVSYDSSVLAAISRSEGPEQFRVVAGQHTWQTGFIEGEMTGKHPWKTHHNWSVIEATPELVFDLDSDEQWLAVIHQSSQIEVSKFF